MSNRTGHYVGLDVGRTNNPTALVIVRVMLPTDPGADPQPVFEVVDVRRSRGAKFNHVVGECAAIYDDLRGDATFAVDRAGTGAGLHDMLLNARLPAYGVHATAGNGHNIRLSGWDVNVSKNHMVESVVGDPLRQGRLLIPRGRGDVLAEEVSQVNMEVTDSGNVTYQSPTKRDGSHGDAYSALAYALTVAWKVGRHWVQAQRLARHIRSQQAEKVGKARERPRSLAFRRGGNTARRELDRIMQEAEARHQRAYNELWDPCATLRRMGVDPDDASY